jgi:hypothetical protein
MHINIWEIHPQACKVEPAEKTCKNTANKVAVQWCEPYANANQSGFWMYSPIDIDLVMKDEGLEVINCERYGEEDYEIVKSLIRQEDQSDFQKWIFPGIGRTKTSFGFVEKNVVQIWTGIIFETPPGWCLHIRSPINFERTDFAIMEAVLETDWMQYDIWMNVIINEKNKPIAIRKDVPIAQIIPVRRESFKGDWKINRNKINRDTPDAERVFEYWLNYNKKKFENGGKQALNETLTKDSTTYFREKTRLLGKEMEPKQSKCPFAHMHKSNDPLFEPVEQSLVFQRFSRKT